MADIHNELDKTSKKLEEISNNAEKAYQAVYKLNNNDVDKKKAERARLLEEGQARSAANRERLNNEEKQIEAAKQAEEKQAEAAKITAEQERIKLETVEKETAAMEKLAVVYEQVERSSKFVNDVMKAFGGMPVENFFDLVRTKGNSLFGFKATEYKNGDTIRDNEFLYKGKKIVKDEEGNDKEVNQKYIISIDDSKILHKEQKKALEQFVSFFKKITTINESIKSLNVTNRSGFIDPRTGEPLSKYEKVADVSKAETKKNSTGYNYVERDGYRIEIRKEDLDKLTGENNIFTRSFQERLFGFVNEKGENVEGYLSVANSLSQLEKQIINQIAVMSMFSSVTADSIQGNIFGQSNKGIFNEVIANRAGVGREPTTDEQRAVLSGEITPEQLSQVIYSLGDTSQYSDFIQGKLNAISSEPIQVDTSSLSDTQRELMEEKVKDMNRFFTNLINSIDDVYTEEKSNMQLQLKDGVGSQGQRTISDKRAYANIEGQVDRFNENMETAEGALKYINEALEKGDINSINEIMTGDRSLLVNQLRSSRLNAQTELTKLQSGQYADNLNTLTNSEGKLVADINSMEDRLYRFDDALRYLNFDKVNEDLQATIDNTDKTATVVKQLKTEKTNRVNTALLGQYEYNKYKEFNLNNEIKQLQYMNNTGLLKSDEIASNNERIQSLKQSLADTREEITRIRNEAKQSGLDLTQSKKSIENNIDLLRNGVGVFGLGYIGMMQQLANMPMGKVNDDSILNKIARENGVKGTVGNEELIRNDLAKLKNEISKFVVDDVYREVMSKVKNLPKGQIKQLNIYENIASNLGNVVAKKNTTGLDNYMTRDNIMSYINGVKDKLIAAETSLNGLKELDTNGKLRSQVHSLENKLQQLNDQITMVIGSVNENSSYDELDNAYKKAFKINTDTNTLNSNIDFNREGLEPEIKKTNKSFDDLKSKVNNVMNSITNAIANVINVIRKFNNIINKTALFIVGAFKKAISTVQRIIQLFGNLGDRIGLTHRNTNILKGSFTELKSVIDLVTGAFNKLMNNQFINEGKKLLSSIQTLNMLIGTELTESTIEWANNLENSFGISAAGLISDLKELTAVMYGLGMSSSDVQIAATNLEAVAMSLSATTGYDFSTVVNKIQSGMKGMTQSIDDLGLSVRESQMDAFLKKLKAQGGEYANIGTSFSSLTEQQRVYVRYAAIMDQFNSKSAYSAENYAKSLNTITGRLSVLNSQVRALKSAIGTLALQLLNKIIMPLTYIVYLAQQAVKSIAELLDIDLNLSAGMNGGDTSEIDDTTDALNEMNDAAKEAKGSLDSLDHVSTMSNSNNSGKDDFDYSKLMDISGDYAKLIEDIGKTQDDFMEKCKTKFWEMINSIKNKFTKWIKDVTGRIIDWDSIKEKWDVIIENLKKSLKHIKGIFEGLRDIIGGLLYSIFDDLDITRLLFKFTEVLKGITHLVDTILKRVAPKIQEFYDKYLSKYVVKFGDSLEKKLNGLIYKLNCLIGLWESHGNESAIDDWFDNLGEKFNQLAIIIKTLFGGKSSLEINQLNFIDDSESNTFNNLVDLAENIHWIINGILGVIKSIAEEIGIITSDAEGLHINPEFINGVLEKINEKLNNISIWLNENKGEIATIISAVTDAIGQIAEAEFDKLMEVLNWLTDHSEFVSKTLDVISDIMTKIIDNIELIIAIGLIAKIVTFTSEITLTMLKLQALSKIIGGTGAGGGIVGLFSKLTKKLKAIPGAIAKIPGAIAKIPAKLTSLGAKFKLLGTKILACFTTTWVGPFVAAIGTVALAFAELKQGWEDFKFNIEDTKLDFSGAFGAFTDENGNKLEVTTQNTKQWAYDIRAALEKVYGDDIPTDAFDRAMSHVMMELESTGDFTFEQTEAIRQNIEKQYNKIGSIDLLDKMAYETENSERVISGLVDELNNKTTELRNTSITNTSGIRSSFVGMSNQINGSCRSSLSFINTLISAINRLNNMSAYKIPKQTSGWASDKGKVSIGTIRGFARANGGTVSSGSLFMANENGKSELIGNFGGYTGVANQDMIITAMKGAIGNSVYDAILRAGGNSGTGTVNNFEICKSGMFVGDDSTVRKLANMINSTNISNRNNIANVGFSM